jgi:signal transduction histidine kinase
MLQVVSNLASNSIRAMDGRGAISVVLDSDRSGATRLSFTDDGPGMPEEIRQRATEPFVSGRKGGTGLGLSVVAGIVRKWGGDIDIASAPGRGTIITITLPPPVSPAEQGAPT